jgi:hypothetical protein
LRKALCVNFILILCTTEKKGKKGKRKQRQNQTDSLPSHKHSF